VVEADRKRVLVVDDANLVRLYYRDALERAGYHVDEALNGLEALEKLYDAPANLLIVDVNMPQMDGFTFLRILRRRELPGAGVPALVISTEAGLQDFEAAQLAGANYYLVKPVSHKVLLEHVALMSGRAR